ncbi:MAG: ferritin family protein [Armatimonadota bacterium]|jgi:rubrerythrin
MVESNALDAIRVGIELERAAVVAYKQAASDAVTEGCKRLFAELLAFEEEHLRYLSSLHDELAGGRSWLSIPGGTDHEHLPPPGLNAESPDLNEQALRRERAALTAALQAEEKARDLFAKAAAEAKDPTGKSIFEHLAEEEDAHIAWVEARLQALPD